MEAIQALQLQTDAKHRRITSQVIQRNTGCPTLNTLSSSASRGSIVSCIARLFLHCLQLDILFFFFRKPCAAHLIVFQCENVNWNEYKTKNKPLSLLRRTWMPEKVSPEKKLIFFYQCVRGHLTWLKIRLLLSFTRLSRLSNISNCEWIL